MAASKERESVALLGRPSEPELRRNFWCMGFWFALNHATVTTPLVVATTLLGKEMADIGSGCLYLATVISSLMLASPLCSHFGPRGGLLIAMGLCNAYVGCFAVAALLPAGDAMAWCAFLGGSICGGVAFGVLWTAQGSYFSETATRLAAATGETREAATGSLAGGFAFVYLFLEVLSKLGFSGLQAIHVEPWAIGLIYLGLGLLSAAMTLSILDLRPADQPGAATSPLAKALGAFSLWPNPILWLLAPTNFTFGFCAAFMNGHVNANFAAVELGPEAVAFLAAITCLIGAVLARLFAPLSNCVGKGPVMMLGAACFLGIPLSLFVLRCCHGWGWWLIVLYALQGSGRAVFESTNRAIFSDFFEGPETENAFANCGLQSSLAFAICFFLQTELSGAATACIVATFALLTPVCYVGAKALHARRRKLAQRAVEDGEESSVLSSSGESETESEPGTCGC